MGSPSAASATIRVASLLPSATEIVCALGMEDSLVGISHECDFPASVTGKPVLTSTRLEKGLPSRGIDLGVREILRSALAVYEVDVAALERAAPDVIVTQDLCDVCAVSLEDVEKAARCLALPGRTPPAIVSLRPTRLSDVLGDVRRVGEAIGRDRAAGDVVAEVSARIQRVRERALSAPSRPSVLTIEWLDPVMIGGTWMPELVEIAGGVALGARPGDRAPTLSAEHLARLAPEVVLVKPCGFRLERTLAESDLLRSILRSLGAPARAGRRVFVADGNAYFNRPGPRIADSLEILAACVDPREFSDLAARHAAAFRAFD